MKGDNVDRIDVNDRIKVKAQEDNVGKPGAGCGLLEELGAARTESLMNLNNNNPLTGIHETIGAICICKSGVARPKVFSDQWLEKCDHCFFQD